MHTKYGFLPWSTVFQPSIKLAREGFPVTEDLVHYMVSAVEDNGNFLCNDPSFALDFCPNGTRLGLGDTMKRKRYADTLETIANQGADAFYSGPIAESIIKAVQATNGTMTLEDMRNFSVAIRDTAQIDYRGYKVASTTSPTSGVIGLGVLKVSETYDHFFGPENVNISTHRLDEAFRFGYGEVYLVSVSGWIAC